jgi:hypothetical protein
MENLSHEKAHCMPLRLPKLDVPAPEPIPGLFGSLSAEIRVRSVSKKRHEVDQLI